MNILLGETPAVLLQEMATALAAVRDPLARHWLILPGKGRAEWLQRAWARTAGIAAHSQIIQLRSLVELAAAGAARQPYFNLETLALRIAAVLPEYREHFDLPVPVAVTADGNNSTATSTGIATPPIDNLTLSWARQLADAVDMGYLCRDPDADAGGGRFAEQPGLLALAGDARVAPALERHLGNLSPSEFEIQAREWITTWKQRGGLPRLWLHLDAGLPKILMQRLLELLNLLPQKTARIYALAPSLHFWGDLRTARRHGALEPTTDPGPLLRAFGRQAQDLHQQLASGPLGEGMGGEELETPAPVAAGSLLARLQTSCRELCTPATPAALSSNDCSFSVHACRSPLRELEVCRDRILQAMHEMPELRPDEVVVLLADSAEYAPIVAAAFQPQDNFSRRVPFRLATAVGSIPAAVGECINLLWQALGDRCDQEQVLALLEQPLISAKFGLDDVGPATILSWLQDACFFWGINAAQRGREHGAQLGDRRHLAAALRRLALGAVVAPENLNALIDGQVPLNRAKGLETMHLARLAAFVETLATQQARWRETGVTNGDGWCSRLTELVEVFMAEGDQVQKQQRSMLLQKLLLALKERIPAGSTLTAGGFKRLAAPLLEELNSLSTGGGGGTGGVTVAALKDWSGTPAKVVCVCGLSAERFPRADQRPPWHPLETGIREWGDPNRRDDDRHALLLAVLSAGARLVLTYEGGSETDDKERPPSTPLADLLKAAAQCCPSDTAAAARYQHPHPLNGFSPVAVATDTPVSARSFLHSDLDGAAALQSGRNAPVASGATLWGQFLPPPDGACHCSSGDLKKLLKKPCELFLWRLGISLPEKPVVPETEEALELNSLEIWKERDRLLQLRLEHKRLGTAAPERDELQKQLLQISGRLPPAGYGEQAWNKIVDETPDPAVLHPAQIEPLPQFPDWENDDCCISGPGIHQWYRSAAGTAVCFTVSKIDKPASRLTYLVDITRLAAVGERGPFSVFSGKGKPVTCNAPAQPDTLLTMLCRLTGLARRLPLPWVADLYSSLVTDKHADNPEAIPADQQTLEKLAEKWDMHDSWGDALPPPSADPAVRLCFRDLEDPVNWPGPAGLEQAWDDAFGDSPVVAAEEETDAVVPENNENAPEPAVAAASLCLRLTRFLHAWQIQACQPVASAENTNHQPKEN